MQINDIAAKQFEWVERMGWHDHRGHKPDPTPEPKHPLNNFLIRG